jgi:ribosome-associated protein
MDSRDFAITAARALDKKQAEDVLVIDIGEKSSFADYLILASGSNERLIAALTDEVEDKMAEEGVLVRSIEGTKESGWILMDYGDMIVNILTTEMRERYNIEKVWADCEKIIPEE